MKTFKLAHISDLHTPPLPSLGVGDFSLKRGLGWLSWQVKRKKCFDEVLLERLFEKLENAHPDHIAVTGDLTNLALDEEYQRSRKILDRLANIAPVSVIPGNHDAYRKDYMDFVKNHWSDYGCDAFPYIHKSDGVAIIGVNSAVPTAPFMATGTVCEDQMKRLPDLLSQAKQEGLFRVVLIHHPPYEGAVQRRKALTNIDEFYALLSQYAPELVLFGHAHKPLRHQMDCGTLILGAGAALSSWNNIPPAHYHIIEIGDDKAITIHHGSAAYEGRFPVKFLAQ